MIAPVLFLLAQATPAAQLPGRVGGWEVGQRESSCTLATAFRSGALVRIEYFPREDEYFLLLADPSWPQIVDGQAYPIDIRGKRAFSVTVEGQGVREPGASHVAVYVPVKPRIYARGFGMPRSQASRPLLAGDTNRRFESILLVDQEMTISRENRRWRTLPLAGIVPAFRALAQCADRLAPGQNSMLGDRLRSRGIQ